MKAQNSAQSRNCDVDEDLIRPQCGGVVLCASWCESVNASVRYTHDTVLHPTQLSIGDGIILPALGGSVDAQRAQAETAECQVKAANACRYGPEGAGRIGDLQALSDG